MRRCYAESQKIQQMVIIVKKTTGLCPSGSYYSIGSTPRNDDCAVPFVGLIINLYVLGAGGLPLLHLQQWAGHLLPLPLPLPGEL